MELKTEILINARPEKVWEVFADFARYPIWNPFVLALEGEVKAGSQIKAVLQGMTFKPVVLVFDKNKELRWLGKLLFSGLFDGEHRFVLHDNGNGTTTFEHAEKFSGILVPLLKSKLETATRAGFQAMNEKLKERVER